MECARSRRIGHGQLHHKRSEDRADRGAALQNAVAKGSVLITENALSRNQGTGPLTRLKKTEKGAANQQARIDLVIGRILNG